MTTTTSLLVGQSARPSLDRRPSLEVFFRPRTVALIGATEAPNSVGRAMLRNLMNSPFGGTVFPVNPNRPSVLGLRAFRSVRDIPAEVDLAVIATPAVTVPEIIRECVDRGVQGAIVISAGFREIGPEGMEREREILRSASGKLRIIGPNCVGVLSPLAGLNASFASGMPRPGNIAFLSQSGALCTSILDWSVRETVGFSAFVSVGSMLDVGWSDLIEYLNDDAETHSIILYMESIGDARSFLSAARAAALSKPVIVLKAGRTEGAAKAAASHTGTLAGSDDVLDAAFRRCGVLRVDSIADLFHMSEVLAKQPHPKGPRLTIVTNAGGPAVMASDALISSGGELAKLSPETLSALDGFLPPHWSHGNPIDVIGDADEERYAKAVAIAAMDPATDGMLLVLSPQAMTDPAAVAEKLRPYAKLSGKPVLASWMGGAEVARGESILSHAGIPTFAFPDAAARIFQSMWRYSDNLRELYETPAFVDDGDSPVHQARAEEIIKGAQQRNRALLTEAESKGLLAAYGIPTVETRVATSEKEAIEGAEAIGYPVVLKLHSETITHKSDIGGVHLSLQNCEAVKGAFHAIRQSVTEKAGSEHFLGVTVQPMIEANGYEVILGSAVDAQFGPVLLFGTGGQLVEVFRDRALGLPPLNTTLARRMMERTKIYQALRGVRGRKAVDLKALERLLVRFSRLVAEQRRIREIDINPLLVSPDRLLALDARIVLHGAEISNEDLPKLAVRPYPAQYVRPWKFSDGGEVLIRPLSAEDEPLMVTFHGGLSSRSVYLRYFGMLSLEGRISHDRLSRTCFLDYDREIALAAERRDPLSGQREIVAVARLTKIHETNTAEFAVVVCDAYQGRGLGQEMVSRLLDIARDEKLEAVGGQILLENQAMIRICRRLGFEVHQASDGASVLFRVH